MQAELEKVLRSVLQPLIAADGGQLYIVSSTEDKLHLHLTGQFSGCPGNVLAGNHIIGPAIQTVAPDLQVELTWGITLPENAELL